MVWVVSHEGGHLGIPGIFSNQKMIVTTRFSEGTGVGGFLFWDQITSRAVRNMVAAGVPQKLRGAFLETSSKAA